MRRRLLLIGGAAFLAIVTVGGVLLRTPPRLKTLKMRGSYPSTLSLSRVASLSLTSNGKPFSGQPIRVAVGDKFDLSCQLSMRPEAAPTGHFLARVFAVFHPVGTGEEVWRKVDSSKSFHDTLTGAPQSLQGHIDKTIEVRTLPAGEYELRVFLNVLDMEGSHHANDLIAKGHLTVESGRDAKVP